MTKDIFVDILRKTFSVVSAVSLMMSGFFVISGPALAGEIEAKAITAFTIPGQTGTTTISEIDYTIALTMPYGTDVTALVPTFEITGTSVNVGEAVQVSGVTPNDFTNPVTYTIFAESSSTQDYVVTITVALNPAKEITAFTVPNQVGLTTINENDHAIVLVMPYGTDVTALAPVFEITGASADIGGTVQTSGVTQNDFTNPVTYTITAEDSSTQEYAVMVAITPISLTAVPTSITITKSALITGDIETAIQEAIAAGLQPIIGTLMNNGTDTSANIRFTPISAGPNIQFWAKDFIDNQWYNFNVIYGGDPEGFSVPAGYGASMNFYVISDKVGTYSIIANLVLASDLSVIAYATLTVGVIAPTPTAPEVTNDDILNTITGMATSMEYSLDGADYVAYATDTFNALDFNGVHTLLVRVAADGESPTGYATTLLFTANISAEPVAGTYTSVQNVILSATGSLSIHYSLDGSIPNCSTGTVYAEAIPVGSSQTITAVPCYQDDYSSPAELFAYVINLPVVPASSGGGGAAITMAISNYETSIEVLSTSTKITWSTTLFSTSRVIYDTVAGKFDPNASPNYGYAFSTAEQDTPAGNNGVTYHTVWLTGLAPDTTYYYRTISHASPDTIGQEKSFTTVKVSEVVIAPVEEQGGQVAGVETQAEEDLTYEAETAVRTEIVQAEEESNVENQEVQKELAAQPEITDVQKQVAAVASTSPDARIIWVIVIVILAVLGGMWLIGKKKK